MNKIWLLLVVALVSACASTADQAGVDSDAQQSEQAATVSSAAAPVENTQDQKDAAITAPKAAATAAPKATTVATTAPKATTVATAATTAAPKTTAATTAAVKAPVIETSIETAIETIEARVEKALVEEKTSITTSILSFVKNSGIKNKFSPLFTGNNIAYTIIGILLVCIGIIAFFTWGAPRQPRLKHARQT